MSSMPKTVASVFPSVESILQATVMLMIVGALCLPNRAPAQTPTAQNSSPAIPGQPRLVLLQASVVDKTSSFVTNIPQSAFKVYENGVEQQLKVFRQDAPV